MLECFAGSVNTTFRTFSPHLAGMDLQDVENRLGALPRGARARLADRLDIDASTVAKILKGTRRLKLGEPEIIEGFLEEAEAERDGGIALPRAPADQVSMYRVAAAGETIALSEVEILRYVPQHPAQANYPRGGAAEIIGESMFPRYKAREIAYFVFDLMPRRGEDVVVELKDGTAILKEYVQQKDGRAFLREYGPEERVFDIVLTKIKAFHAVVGRG